MENMKKEVRAGCSIHAKSGPQLQSNAPIHWRHPCSAMPSFPVPSNHSSTQEGNLAVSQRLMTLVPHQGEGERVMCSDARIREQVAESCFDLLHHSMVEHFSAY